MRSLRISAFNLNTNLAAAFEKREGIADYRTTRMLLMTGASVMHLSDPGASQSFFSIPSSTWHWRPRSENRWKQPCRSLSDWLRREMGDPPEKDAEFSALKGLSLEARARRRTESVWREIDKSCVVGSKRYLTSIKSGPNTINDTQVQAMTRAIIDNHAHWLQQTRKNYSGLGEVDIVVGLTYGTDERQINKETRFL